MTLAEGIDVSLWQSAANVEHALNGKGLIVVKVSQRDFTDPLAAAHFATARARGTRYVGGYHWLDPTPSAEAQADLFLRNVPADADFLAVDVEGAILAIGQRMGYARDMARRFIAHVHAHDQRPVLQYSSRGTWPGSNGQDGNWVADYSGDPNRGLLRLMGRGVPWLIWQYGMRPLDLDRYDPDALARLIHKTPAPAPEPVPAPGGTKVKFIQISSADADKLPSRPIPAGTSIETFDGEAWDTLGPTNIRYIPGLVDGHTNRFAVVIYTGRFFADKVRRYVAQVAVLP